MKNIQLREIVSSKARIMSILGLSVALLTFVVAESIVSAAPGINKMINFQGKVVNTNGTNVADANYTFRFRIYTAATGDTASPCATTCIWEESKSLSTVNGIFQTNLGSVTTLPGAVNFDTDNLYVGVLFNGDTEMTPRIRLTAVPYAFNADRLGGLEKSAFVQLNPGSQQTGAINVSGNITTASTLNASSIDAASSNSAITIGGTNSNAITLAENATMGGGLSLSLQGNNALSLGSTTAAGGIIFRDGTVNGRQVTLSTVGLSASYSLNLPSAAPVAGAQCLQTGSGSTTNLIFGACGASGNFLELQSTTPGTAQTGNFNITGVGIAGTYMASSFDTATSIALNLGTGNAASVAIAKTGVVTAIGGSATVNGDITLNAGFPRSITIANAAGTAGDNLTIKAGNAGLLNTNGGNLTLAGGLGSGSGVKGVVLMETAAFSTTTDTNCSVNCTVSQASIDNTSAIIVNATSPALTITVPDPTNTVAGRLVYITGGNGSNDFALNLNSGATLVTVAMRQNSTATLIWSGSDWTAAGASSSTTLQAAYDNTLASAGGAEIILNNTATSNGLTIRNNAGNPIIGSVFEIQSSTGTNLLSVNNNAVEYVSNGGAENAGAFNTDWFAVGGGSVNRNISLANVATGQASVEVNSAAALNAGARTRLAPNLATSTTYQVSLTGKLASGSFTTLQIAYSRDGGSSSVPCTIYSTQTLVTTGWSKVTCSFTTDATVPTSSYIVVRQTDATARSYFIDNVSVTLRTNTSNPPNVQVGGGLFGGAVTLMTLDRASSPPVADGNDVYYGSMYYDTTTGRIQCYEADGWGACGSAPDQFVNLTPEYAGAVLNGTGVGTLTADFCSNQSAVLAVNTSLCGTGQALNYYKWTSPQATQQTYSIYLSYQLAGGFKEFQGDSTIQLTARTDNVANAAVTYQMYRSESGAVTACGSETTVTTSANIWQTVGINGNEQTGCGFSKSSANSFVIFKINVKANSNANAYVGTLSFTTTNQ